MEQLRLDGEACQQCWWLVVAILDVVVQYALKLRLGCARHKVAVCDRYLDDAMIDFSLRFPELVRRDGVLARVLRFVCPTPRHAIPLAISEDEQRRRIEEKQEPFPDTEELRIRRGAAYLELARSGRVQTVDGGGPVSLVFAEIWHRLGLSAIHGGTRARD